MIVSGRVRIRRQSVASIVDRIDQQLAPCGRNTPVQIGVTDLSVISARNGALMIDKLNRGLTIEIVFVAAFIGIAFWSPVVMLISILPGLFPIVFAGSLLLVLGQGLQFASVIALTVSFGLGLSATIHFLNRLQIEDTDPDPAVGVERATILVGPPLILTSAVLACGLAMTVLSSLPSLRLFGVKRTAMIAALFADLFMLRPIGFSARSSEGVAPIACAIEKIRFGASCVSILRLWNVEWLSRLSSNKSMIGHKQCLHDFALFLG